MDTKELTFSNRNELLDYFHNSVEHKIIDITTGMNGHPKGPDDKGIIGFETFQEAEEFARNNGLEVCLFKSRDGWHFWENVGTMNRPLTVDDYVNDLGDDWMPYEPDKEVFRDRLQDFINSDADLSIIQKFVDHESMLRDAYEEKEESETIIHNGIDYEAVPERMMAYHEDVLHWAIGVLIPHDWKEGEDEEIEDLDIE